MRTSRRIPTRSALRRIVPVLAATLPLWAAADHGAFGAHTPARAAQAVAAQTAGGGTHLITPERAIVGTVFEDTDGDGLRGSGEGALAGRPIALAGPTGAAGAATSDGTGAFAFGLSAAGAYTLTLAVPAGWAATRANEAHLQFDVAPNSAAGALGAPVQFGLRRVGAATPLVVDVDASTGCQTGPGVSFARPAASAIVGEHATLRFRVRGAADAWISVQDIAPDGAVRSLAEKRAVDGGQEYGIAVPIGAVLGTRRVLWRAFRAAGDAQPAAEGACAFEVVAPEGPAVTVRPDRLTFDRVATGGTSDRILTVRNAGGAPLTVFGLALQSDVGTSPFTLPAPWSTNTLLMPGEERGVTVRFAPKAEGAWQDFVLVRTDDDHAPLVTISLSGETSGVPRLAAAVATDRGCVMGDSGPLFVAGEPVDLTLNVVSGDGENVQAVLEDIGPSGETAVIFSGAAPAIPWRRAVRARRSLAAGGARLSASTGGGARYAYGQCDWFVAAGLTDIGGTAEDVGGPAPVPLAGARVTVAGPEAQTVLTGADGSFRVAVAQPGRYTVAVEPPEGYAPSGPQAHVVWVRGFAGEDIAGLRFSAARADGAPTATPTPPAALPTLIGPTATPALPTPVPTPTIPTTCRVSITPRTGTANVGQRVAFRAAMTPTRGNFTYSWGYDGDAIADYSESTAGAWRTTPLRAADMRASTFALYWKPALSQRHPNNAGPVARRVWVTVRDGVGQCTDVVTLSVERNAANSTRQAEDFYTTNHTQFVQREHALWHQRYAFEQPFYDGTLFFDFHVQFMDRFNRWRHEFGYPEIGTWDSAQPLPRGPDIDHASRNAFYRPFAKPASFTANGGAVRGWNGMPCDVTGGGQSRLSDYPADRRLLGCAVTEPWHNTIHLLIGGDMLNPPSAPRDPIFWRWHRWVDTVNRDRRILQAGGRTGDAAASGDPSALEPPHVIYQTPFHLHPYVVSLSSYAVTFDAGVVGVRPAMLTVNGSPATSVAGAGAGPYVFTGFAPPALGPVEVALDRNAVARAGATAPAAALGPPQVWPYTLVAPKADDDGDGLLNGDEVLRTLSWPDDADSDDDGLDDAAEWRAGTIALAPDTDGDGAGDGCEARAGSDPLAAASRSTRCGTEFPYVCRTSPAPASVSVDR